MVPDAAIADAQSVRDVRDATAATLDALQKMLDDVTFLRRDALSEFSAHELKEDRATDCFLEMCHSLSDKINAKLSRQRLDQRMNELVAAVNARHDSEREAMCRQSW